MSVHPDEDAESRGHIQAHDVKWSQGRPSAARQAFLNDSTTASNENSSGNQEQGLELLSC